MIVNLILNTVVLFVGAIFSWLPVVTTLPTIGGFDIDAALVSGMGIFNYYCTIVWPIHTIFLGFLVLMGYYTLKVGLRVFFGNRTPGGQ